MLVSFTFTLADSLELNHDNISLCIYHPSLHLNSFCNWSHIYPRNTPHNTLLHYNTIELKKIDAHLFKHERFILIRLTKFNHNHFSMKN